MDSISSKWKGGHLKMKTLDGKWERVWVHVKGSTLYYFDKKPPARSEPTLSELSVSQFDLRFCRVNREITNSTSTSRFELIEHFPPGAVAAINTDSSSSVYIPNTNRNSATWPGPPVSSSTTDFAVPQTPSKKPEEDPTKKVPSSPKGTETQSSLTSLMNPLFKLKKISTSHTNLTKDPKSGKQSLRDMTSATKDPDAPPSPTPSPVFDQTADFLKANKSVANNPSSERTQMQKQQILFSARNEEEKYEWTNMLEFAIRDPRSWTTVQLNFERAHKLVKDVKAKHVGDDDSNLLAANLEKAIYSLMASLVADLSSSQIKTIEEHTQDIEKFGELEEDKLTKVQAVVRGWLTRRRISQRSLTDTQPSPRLLAQREVIRSEQEYLDNLLNIQQWYKVPQQADDPEGHVTLFDNLREIAKLSREIMEQLANEDEEKVMIGAIFLKSYQRMNLLYTEYSTDYCSNLQQILRKKKKNAAFKKLFKNLETDKKNVLSSLLLLPILRLIKYEWLLNECLQCTPREHPDQVNLFKACTLISHLNKKNEMNRDVAERFEKVFDISMKFGPTAPGLLDGSHEWVREGPMLKVLVSGPEKCYLYMLSDALIVTLLMPDGTKDYLCEIRLDQILISNMEDNGYVKNCFKLTKRGDKSDMHVFGASTTQEKQSWIMDLGEVIHRASTKKKGIRTKSPVINLDRERPNVRKDSSFLWLLEGPVRKCVVNIPSELPKIRLGEYSRTVMLQLDGPEENADCSPIMPELDLSIDQDPVRSRVYCRSVSTYPIISRDPLKRDGDPVADHYNIKLTKNRLFVALADGCSWGPRPLRAAQRASAQFVKFLEDNADEADSLEDVGHNLLLGASAAHDSIIKGHEEDIWSAGTTTLLGGVMLHFEQIGANDPVWGFAFLSVGDCKAFVLRNSDKEVVDMTALNRGNLSNVSDPGGRIGPYVGDGAPDLRNLKLYFYEVHEGDIVFICSDGVHDNFDPQQHGLKPKDVSSELDGESWKEFETQVRADELKSKFRTDALRSLILKDTQDPSPQQIVNALLGYCIDLTKKCRDFMESNLGARQPTNYEDFPGKFDHTTCIAFRVGAVGNVDK